MKKVLLLDHDGSIHEIHEHKKFVIKYSGGLYAKFEPIFESDDIEEILKVYEKENMSAASIDDVNVQISIMGKDSGISGYDMNWVRKELEKYL